jgi:trehalose synthase
LKRNGKLVQINDYEQYAGAEQVQRVKEKAALLGDRRVVHINSTYYGGGVAELLGSLTLLMNSAGISTEWRTIQGAPDFFTVTKAIPRI